MEPEEVFRPNKLARGDYFHGRDTALSKAVESLGSDVSHQLAVWGPPGSGKSSLANKAVEKFGAQNVAVTSLNSVGEKTFENFNALLLSSIEGAFLPAHIRELPLIGPLYSHAFQHLNMLDATVKAMEAAKLIFIIDGIDQGGPNALPWLQALQREAFNLNAGNPTNLKTIAVFAGHRSDTPSLWDDSSRQRVHFHEVPYMTNDELRMISADGFDTLGLQYDDFSIGWIHHKSCGLPRQLHDICKRVAKLAISRSESRIGQFLFSALLEMESSDSLANEFGAFKSSLQRVSARAEVPIATIERFLAAQQTLYGTAVEVKALSKRLGIAIELGAKVAEGLSAEGLMSLWTDDHKTICDVGTYHTRLIVRTVGALHHKDIYEDVRGYRRIMESYSGRS